MGDSVSRVNPGISLAVPGGPQGPAIGGASLGLGQMMPMIQGMQTMQLQQQEIANQRQTLMQNQQQFQGRALAGQIIAAAPDLDTAMQNITQNPTVMGYYPQALSDVKAFQTQQQLLRNQQQQQVNLGLEAGQIKASTTAAYASAGASSAEAGRARADTQRIGVMTQGEQQKNTTSAVSTVLSSLGPALQDPANGVKYFNNALDQLTPAMRQQAARPLAALRDSLFEGLPSNPEDAKTELTKRTVALQIGSGMPVTSAYGGAGAIAPQYQTVPTPTGAQQPAIVGGLPGGLAGGAASPLGPLAAPVGAPGPGATQEKYLAARGGDMADYQKNLDNLVNNGRQVMQTLQEARNAQQQFQAGGGANVYAKVGQFVQGLGGSPELVDKIANGNLAASQEFNKLMVNTTMGQIKDQIPSGSRLAQQEFKVFQDNNPNIQTDPRAIEKIGNFWTKLYQTHVAEQGQLNDYIKQGGDISSWPAVWAKRAEEQQLVTPQMQGTGKNQPTYNSPDDVVSAFKAGKMSRQDAATILKNKGWAQ